MPSIHFFSEDIQFKLSHSIKIKRWLKDVVEKEKNKLDIANFIFCSDKYLHRINHDFLKHDTYTDVVTFDNREDNSEALNGDIFISIERVRENAKKFSVSFEDELLRVMVHGILHLVGYADKTPSQISQMRKKENAYLSLLEL